MSNEKETEQASPEKLEKDLANYKLYLEEEQVKKDRYIEQITVYEERVQLRIDGTRKGKLNPEFEHEKDPKYWDLYAKELEYQLEEAKMKHKGVIEGFDSSMDYAKEEIERLTKELEE